jgi:Leucine-rich repeat (LRR) protein
MSCSVSNENIYVIFMPSDGTQNNNKLKNLDFAANLPNLMSLDVANNNVNNISGLANLQNLQELYLGGNPVLSSSSQLQLIDNSEFCQKLVRLNLGGVTGNASAILSIVKKCVNLTWLQIYGIGASESQITSAITQSTHSKLTYLKISHNGFTTVPSSLKYIKKVVVEYDDSSQG